MHSARAWRCGACARQAAGVQRFEPVASPPWPGPFAACPAADIVAAPWPAMPGRVARLVGGRRFKRLLTISPGNTVGSASESTMPGTIAWEAKRSW